MQRQSWAMVKRMSLALLFLVTLLCTFGEHFPSLGAVLFQSPLAPLSTLCLRQAADGYIFDFLGYLPNGDGTTTLTFRVSTTNQKDISHLAFGTGSWTPVAPLGNSTVAGSLGAYRVVWTNTNGNPGFPSIKFEPQFNGYSQGQQDLS